MQAALLYDRDDIRFEELPVPKIGPGEVLLRTMSASVCGTDIRMFKNGHAFARTGGFTRQGQATGTTSNDHQIKFLRCR